MLQLSQKTVTLWLLFGSPLAAAFSLPDAPPQLRLCRQGIAQSRFGHQRLWMSTLSPVPKEGNNHHEEQNRVVKISPSHFSKSRFMNVTAGTAVNDDEVSKPSYGPISMTLDELSVHLGGRGRARLAWDCYSLGIDPAYFYGKVIRLGLDVFETIHQALPSARRTQKLGPAALKQLASLYPNDAHQLEDGVASLNHISQAKDTTTKLLLKLADGSLVETVIIPWNGVRSTLCISSQVGCRQACRFCATGKMGLQRSLSSDEILAQMFWAKKQVRQLQLPPITNVVFMGMGEPADNSVAVTRAAEILTTRELFQLSATKVTISTVAPTPESFMEFAKAPAVLAWSVHAARDEVRRELVPTTRYSMDELCQGLIRALLQRPHNFRTTMLEYVMIANVNIDIETDGAALVELTQKIQNSVPGCKLIVNLIPYNPIYESVKDIAPSATLRPYEAPTPESVKDFQQYLWSKNVYAHVRTTRGDDESAACGQLATQKSKKTP